MWWRLQRILTAVEIFALVLWVGGCFLLTVVALPSVEAALGAGSDAAWDLANTLADRFQGIEIICGLVVLASNFVKSVILGRAIRLQRYALLVATVMMLFTLVGAGLARPRIAEKRAEVRMATPGALPRDEERLRDLQRQWHWLGVSNLALGLFLVYAYRHFEEQKPLVLAKLARRP